MMGEKELYGRLAKKYEKEADSIKDRNIKRFGKVHITPALTESLERAAYCRKKEGNKSLYERDYREASKYGGKKPFYIIEENVRGIIERELNNLKTKQSPKSKSLMGRLIGSIGETKFVFATLSVITLVSALFFISFSFTGDVILGLTDANSRWIGLCLFVCGLIFTFFYLRQK